MGARLARAEYEVYDDPTELDPTNLKLLWLNSPSNPTGRVLSKEELTRTVAWAREHGVLIFSDECYIELGWEADPVSVLHPDVCGGSYEGIVSVHSSPSAPTSPATGRPSSPVTRRSSARSSRSASTAA